MTLLGEFSLTQAAGISLGLTAERAQSLLAYLVLHRHAPQPRAHLAFQLWPDSGESQARTNLRNLLHSLCQALPDPDRFLAADATMIRWRPDAPAEIDLVAFETALNQAHGAVDPATARGHLETALAHYTGDLLLGNQDEWLLPHRERLRLAYLETLDRLVALAIQQGDSRAAVHWAQRLVREDPIGEQGYVQLMQVYALSGDRAGVHRVYQACVDTLARELGAEPSRATQEAYRSYLRLDQSAPGEESVATLAEPAPTARVQPLPVAATPLLGRTRELAEVAQLLADPTCRLLTILGVGGVGKSRLALETAAAHRTVFADGVAFVAMTGLQRPEYLTPAIADAVGCVFTGSSDSRSQLLTYLSTRQLLLVLDDFEHLIDATELVVDILTHAPGVKVLVTSHQRLDVQEEWVYPLAGLDVPEDAEADPEASSAMKLFVRAAQRIDRTFTLDEQNRQALYTICRLVEGMPLAIELAASWVRSLACQEIADEIQRDINFLQANVRNVPDRHRSLRAVFDHSWQLLSPDEQSVFLGLVIFQGGFTRAAAAAVAGADLARLTALVDKSLVQRMGTRGRFDLHELLRQYGHERLAAMPEGLAQAQARHARYFLGLLAARTEDLRGDRLIAVHADLLPDVHNLRAAWEWAVAHRQWALLRPALHSLALVHDMASWLHEAETTCRRTLAELEASAPRESDLDWQVLLGHAKTWHAWFLFRLGRGREALALAEESLAEVRGVGDLMAHTQALNTLGMAHLITGQYAQAEQALAEALALPHPRPYNWDTILASSGMGLVALAQGRAEDAYRLTGQAVAFYREVGNPRMGAFALMYQGEVTLLLGRVDEAEAALQEGLALARQIGDRFLIGNIGRNLGLVMLARGQLAEAERHLGQALTTFGETGDPWGLAHTQRDLGRVYLQMDSLAAACAALLEALAVSQQAHIGQVTLDALAVLAQVYVAQGDLAAAARLAAHVAHSPMANQATRDQCCELLDELARQLPPETQPDRAAAAAPDAIDRLIASLVAGRSTALA